MLILVGLGTGCSDDSNVRRADPDKTPLTPAAAQSVLDEVGGPEDGNLAGGTFSIGRTIKGPPSAKDGRLASSSWDVYFVFDNGAMGAWGAGLDIFASETQATASAKEQAQFWVCDGPRRSVEDFPPGESDWLGATSCAEVLGDGYTATASMARGIVTTNLTVSAPSREQAEAALTRVWASLDTTAADVISRLN